MAGAAADCPAGAEAAPLCGASAALAVCSAGAEAAALWLAQESAPAPANVAIATNTRERLFTGIPFYE